MKTEAEVREAIAAERLRCACLVEAQVGDEGDRASIALHHILWPDPVYDANAREGWNMAELLLAYGEEERTDEE